MELQEEIGEVVEVSGTMAKVRIKRSEACESCAAHGLCKLLSKGYMVMEAENPSRAHVGQEVVVSLYTEDPVKASLLLYGVPLICFLGGCLLGHWLNLGGMKNLSTFLGGIIFVAASYVAIKILYKKYEQHHYQPVITRIASGGQAL